ncbi:MAG: hypothetical protein JKX94_09225 [Sneathiella sp.]|nr:hypothetical protein [Sneathiella sp.]
MILKKLFARHQYAQASQTLYQEIVRQARQPVFYLEAEVPDTIDGRYEMISLHAFLVMRRFKRDDEDLQVLSQAVFDLMFADMDQSLREIGVGDLSVGKRIKAMAKVFYGRIVAYETALDGGSETLETALVRNHYGTLQERPKADSVANLAGYIREMDEFLLYQKTSDLKAGFVKFCQFGKTRENS